MEAAITNVYLFNNEEEIRYLNFNDGLNIITGDSKTGKSAVIEIIDYCLFAKRSTIPVGVITNWTELFCIILKVAEKRLVIARFKKSTQMYFSVETEEHFLNNFSMEYFENKNSLSLDDTKKEFEKHLGISVLDTRSSQDEDKRSSGGKATMRSFMPFLFQHQNLIANKHSLFYRFDDFYKRKKTIDDYPILMGWENAEFFNLRRELESKQKELGKSKKLAEKLKISNEELKINLYGLVSIYYSFIGKDIDEDISLSELRRISKNLPLSNVNSIGDLKTEQKLKEIDDLIWKRKSELNRVNELLSTIKTNNNESQHYGRNINRLKSLASIENNMVETNCPLCEQEVKEINEKISAITNSNEKLTREFENIGTYVIDANEENLSLRNERDTLKKELKSLSIEAEALRFQIIKEFSTIKEYEKGLLLKGQTEANAANLIGRNKLLSKTSDNFTELEEDIKSLKSKLEGYNLKEKIKKAEVELSKKMSDICDLLDFEAEFKPGKIYFDLEKFTLKYSIRDSENILLSEMGSGSNWLAIHLSAFLGFLHLHSITKSSKIPSILILDQPSQVYFPKVYRELDENVINEKKVIDDNRVQVKNIFKVISNEILKIESACGYKPQVIVLEHADEKEFDQFIKYRWSKEGKKLI